MPLVVPPVAGVVGERLGRDGDGGVVGNAGETSGSIGANFFRLVGLGFVWYSENRVRAVYNFIKSFQ